MKNLIFTFVLSIILFTTAFAQTTWVVGSLNNSGTGTLRAAVASASNGDIIRFNPNLIANGSDSIVLSSSITFSKSLTFIGLYSASDTLYISGGNTNRVFHIQNTTNISLDSMVIINGYEQYGNGGAIYFYNSDSLFINKAIFRNNHAGFSGGAIGIWVSTTTSTTDVFVNVSNTKMTNNSSLNTGGGGGAIYFINNSANCINPSIQLTNTLIQDNTAVFGGGLYFHSSKNIDIDIDNSIISDNQSTIGGGIFSEKSSGSYSTEINIVNSFINNNSAVSKGGGVYANSHATVSSYTNSVTVNISNTTVSGNTAGDDGGGIYCSGTQATYISTVLINNSTISNNTANNGGGIFSSAKAPLVNSGFNNITSSSSVTINKSTLNNNTAISNGGGVYSYVYNATGSVTNAISDVNCNTSTIYGNSAALGGGIYSYSYSGTNNGSNSNVNVVNSTITGNSANTGGGVYSKSKYNSSYNGALSTINTVSSIMGINGVSSVYNSHSPTIVSSGYNLFSNTSISGSISNDILGVNTASLNLDTLAYNGGTTKTLSPTFPSVAINAGNPNDNSNAQNAFVAGIREVGAAEICVSTTSIDVINSCDNYTWIDGVTYYSSTNTPIFTINNTAGCDSVITLDLTITGNSSNSTNTIVTCDSLIWIDGITYTTSNNIATHTLVNSNGCDSIVTLDLTILSSTGSTDVQSACDSYTWINGITYTVNNNTAIVTYTNVLGCDSIVTLDLTILNSTSTDVQSACVSYIWIDGITYLNSNNTAIYTTTNAAGCDSVIQLDLTIIPVDTSIVNQGLTLTAQASNATYQWIDCSTNSAIGSETNAIYVVTQSGDYAVEVTQNGCVDTSSCYTFTNVGIENVAINDNIKIYPNPTSNELHIETKNFKIVEVQVLDHTGKVVMMVHSSFELIDVEALSTGVYQLLLIGENETVTKQFIKQ